MSPITSTGDAKPHFTTIADFVSRSRNTISAVTAQVPVNLLRPRYPLDYLMVFGGGGGRANAITSAIDFAF